jgi:hypothetical protein
MRTEAARLTVPGERLRTLRCTRDRQNGLDEADGAAQQELTRKSAFLAQSVKALAFCIGRLSNFNSANGEGCRTLFAMTVFWPDHSKHQAPDMFQGTEVATKK